jgi:hypothetical protein
MMHGSRRPIGARVRDLFDRRHTLAFRMLLFKGKINQELINILLSWRHSGFNIFCGPRIYPRDEDAMENLARYIIRASFSQERMTYVPEESRVTYQSKACPRVSSGNGKDQRTFEPLEWLASMCSKDPDYPMGACAS